MVSKVKGEAIKYIKVITETRPIGWVAGVLKVFFFVSKPDDEPIRSVIKSRGTNRKFLELANTCRGSGGLFFFRYIPASFRHDCHGDISKHLLKVNAAVWSSDDAHSFAASDVIRGD